MKFRSAPFLSVVLLTTSSTLNAFTISFDYSYDSDGFFDDPARKSTLESAGAFFGSRIADDLAAINSSSRNSFSAEFSNPATGDPNTLDGYNVAADTLVVFAGARSIGGSTLGIGGPGGFSARGSDSYLELVRTRGESGAAGDRSFVTDFGPWGGSLAFDSDVPWYFDNDPSTDESFTGNDFYSVALHELVHVLGFGTSDAWDNRVAGGLFEGPAAGRVALSGDDRHWLDGTFSDVNGVAQETAMDPSITLGTRKGLTELDLNGLRDIGWEVTAIPLPSAFILFGSGLIVFARRIVRG